MDEFIRYLQDMGRAARAASNLWSDEVIEDIDLSIEDIDLSIDYPDYLPSFDEFVIDLVQWVETTKSSIEEYNNGIR